MHVTCDVSSDDGATTSDSSITRWAFFRRTGFLYLIDESVGGVMITMMTWLLNSSVTNLYESCCHQHWCFVVDMV